MEKALTFTFKNPFGANLTIPAFCPVKNEFSYLDTTPKENFLLVPFQVGMRLSGKTFEEFKKQELPEKKDQYSYVLTKPIAPKPWKFTGKLFENQATLKSKAFPIISQTGSVSLFLPCSWGKTIQATELAASLVGESGGRVLVLVTRIILEGQWQDTFEKFTDAKTEIIGTRKGKATYPVVESKVTAEETPQLVISRIGRIKNFSGKLDVLILDEAHFFCTDNNLQELLKLEPKYVIVLTATPNRDDGMEKILVALAGNKKHQFWAISKKPFKVYPLISGFSVADCETKSQDKNLPDIAPDSSRVRLESALAALQPRNDKIIRLIRKIVSKTGFKCAIVGDRVTQLDYIYTTLQEKGIDVGRLWGKDKIAKNARVLVGGIKKIGTGWDEKSGVKDWDGERVDLLFMIISTAKMEQVSGRVFRSDNPKIIQILDDHRWFDNTWKENVKWFESREGDIQDKGTWEEIAQMLIEEGKADSGKEELIIGGGENEVAPEVPDKPCSSKKKEVETDIRIQIVKKEAKRVGHF